METSRLAKQLIQIKEELERKNSKRLELQGEWKALMKRMKEEYNVSTVEEANKLISSMEKEITKLENEINSDYEKLQELLNEYD